jgi:hypothetical protein
MESTTNRHTHFQPPLSACSFQTYGQDAQGNVRTLISGLQPDACMHESTVPGVDGCFKRHEHMHTCKHAHMQTCTDTQLMLPSCAADIIYLYVYVYIYIYLVYLIKCQLEFRMAVILKWPRIDPHATPASECMRIHIRRMPRVPQSMTVPRSSGHQAKCCAARPQHHARMKWYATQALTPDSARKLRKINTHRRAYVRLVMHTKMVMHAVSDSVWAVWHT